MLNPVWLNTFKSLIDTGHFTRTAQKLHMTQPGVSQHIRKLEDACGHPLIHRQKKHFELTEQGRRVYEYAMQLENNEKQLLESLNFDDPTSGVCKLACSGSLALQLYPEMLNLQCDYPELVIQLEVAPNHKILSGVKQGEIDLGMVTDIPAKNTYECIQIGREALLLIFPGTTNFKNDITDIINKLGIIRHPDADHYLSLYFSQCGNPDLESLIIEELPVSGYVNQLSQILLPVAKGLGFTILPQSAVDSFSEKELLTIYRPDLVVSENLYTVKKSGRQLPARYETIVGAIRSVLSSV